MFPIFPSKPLECSLIIGKKRTILIDESFQILISTSIPQNLVFYNI